MPSIDAATQPFRDAIERFLQSIVEGTDEGAVLLPSTPANLREALAYSLLGGGKRLRPLLTVLACDACGGRWQNALPAAAATEMIHAFSLVHDDLPAMDDDDLRRGRPTVHRKFGEAMAILVGDALQSLAAQVILSGQCPESATCTLLRELTTASTAMIVGQVFDTIGGQPASLSPAARLTSIHEHKTGALIRASARMGAICAEADSETLAAISQYGEAVGHMFQIVDDLIDVTQPAEHTGKATGKDAAAGKLTYPVVHGIEGAWQCVHSLNEQAHNALESLGSRAALLEQVCDYLAIRTC
ncbi:MAG: polyprenyl synthetase family protein [Phycisphaerales bacterium]